ncbi:MAG: cell division topological specificity factor MinE [Dorea formicigenerans]
MLKKSSVSVAKSRLKLLIVSDRISCSPAEYENIPEIYSRHYPNIWNLQKITFMLKYTEHIFSFHM